MTKTSTYTLLAQGLTGNGWLKRLEKNKYNVSTYAKQLLLSPEWDKHRLEKGEEVRVVLVPHKDVGTYPTTAEIRAYAEKLGYITPPVEVALLIREEITDEEIERLGLWYIVTLHEPIKGSDGDPRLLDSDRSEDGRWLDTYWDNPDIQWGVVGASAFLVPASTQLSGTELALEPENLDLPNFLNDLKSLISKYEN